MQSLRTNVMPCPGYTVLEQNQQFSSRIPAPCWAPWRLPFLVLAASPLQLQVRCREVSSFYLAAAVCRVFQLSPARARANLTAMLLLFLSDLYLRTMV